MKNDTSKYKTKTARSEKQFERPHLENRMQLLGNRLEKFPIYEVEPEITEWARHYADVFAARFKNDTNDIRWKGSPRNNYIGMIGQKCFEIVLQQHDIPYVPNDPVIDWRESKKYDFLIPLVGTIEVKTIDCKENQTRLLIKCSEWHNSDYCVALKLQDALPSKVWIMGYAEGKDVPKFHYAENTLPCPNDPCYWEYLENLHPANEFIEMLRTKTASLWNEQET